ncbi:hypothetical protein BDQ17DRAFT_287695 [Cyathus striatus]|nr:hypothetical protein BDQ17DRAFT_287695 [Cyathus striatus]
MSSELSNALNPYASQSRPRNTPQSYQPSFQPSPQPDPQPPLQQVHSPLHQYVPHRSELELAISEPPPHVPSPVVAPASWWVLMHFASHLSCSRKVVQLL